MRLKLTLMFLLSKVIFADSMGIQYNEFNQTQNSLIYSLMNWMTKNSNHSIFIGHDLKKNLDFSFESQYKTIKIFYGNYYLNEYWNQLIFLRKRISDEVPFSLRTRKGIYIDLDSKFLRNGFFYLEDHSKGISLFINPIFIIYDFYNQRWGFSGNYKNKYISLYGNMEGEKKNYQGISTIKWGNERINHYVFYIRNWEWDNYHYGTDSYFSQKENLYKSFLNVNNFQFFDNKVFLFFFRKGNVNFINILPRNQIFSNSKIKWETGISYNETQNGKDRFINKGLYNQLINIFNKYYLHFEFTYFLNNSYNFKFSIIEKQSNYIGLGIFINKFEIEKLLQHFDIFSIQFEYNDYQKENQFQRDLVYDRSYWGGFILSRFRIETLFINLNLYYSKKYLSINNQKENIYFYFGSQIFL